MFGIIDVDDLTDVPPMYPFLLWTWVRASLARAAGRETRSSQKAASRPRQTLVSSVVMVNLLVAMFVDTYTKAARNRLCAALNSVR